MAKRTNRGVTLVETLIASAISVLAVTAGTTAFLSGSYSWAKGEIEMASEGSGNFAMRIIAEELREAMFVKVASDGMRIDYFLPMKDGDGAFIFPIVPDGVSRRLYFDDDDLILKVGSSKRVICQDVLFSDPRIANGSLANEGVGNGRGTGKALTGGTGSGALYTPFIATPGALTREVTVKLVTMSKGHTGKTRVSSKREVVLARNVPRIF